ncbi:Uncharacterised protein [Vibrio cholerae]|nr:Uncharacterised protein [Vibrio cholerae]CSD59866.1 Uncharacterised protein [Vibrio cholerae]
MTNKVVGHLINFSFAISPPANTSANSKPTSKLANAICSVIQLACTSDKE